MNLSMQVFKKLMREYKIHHYLTYSSRKAVIVEHFNLTIKTILYKILSHEKSLKWTHYMDKAFDIYNKREHNTIKCAPVDAEKI